MGEFDINVDYNALCVIEDKLKKLQYDLAESTSRMKDSIVKSENFLAGNQFEKAKSTTSRCIDISNKTATNIYLATKFIVRLREIIDSYGSCGYKE